MSDLKNCHFCGGEARFSRDGYSLDLRVRCDECGARTEDFETDKEAIAAWNRRSPPAAVPAIEVTEAQADVLGVPKAVIEKVLAYFSTPPIWNVTPDEVKAAIAEGPGGIISVEPSSPPAAVPDEWRKLLLAAKILYQNAEGCVANHHARDFKSFGIPGWLADCKRDIENAEASLSGISAAPAAVPEGWAEPAAWRWRIAGGRIWVHSSEKPEPGKYFNDDIVVGRDVEVEPLYAHPAVISAAPAAPTAPKAETSGPYEARICKNMPADCCDYGVISLSERIEVCRVWKEQDARAIAAALSAALVVFNGWQPFPSCPEGGTEFQAWVIGSNGQGFWEPKCRLNPETGAFEIWGRVDYDQDDWATYPHIAPTHWQPLPAAPTEARDE